MALDESQRHELHTRLDLVLGPRPADLLMSQVPTTDWDQLATKQDLALMGAELRAEFRQAILEMTQKLYFATAGLVFASGTLAFAAARLGA